MGKRSNFERKDRDYYPTPFNAVLPLGNHIETGITFAEPCAGDGRLVKHLETILSGQCVFKSDIEPIGEDIVKLDAMNFVANGVDYIITNPPWDRKILHPMIEHFRNQADTWLLFDADWMHTRQSSEIIKYCHKIVSVGRVSWLDDGKSGKDNSCWYLFKKEKAEVTELCGRIKK